jgi:TfuA protein
MRVIAFAGPSLPPAAREPFVAIEWRPPAEAGDLLRLDAGPGATICLIDGYFDHRPAVRHKEILLLLSEGVRVLGASSIGALRAAEMDGSGMVGIGAIYSAYRRGTIVGDDEVALIHGPAESGWKPLSVPLADVRATLASAVRRRRVGKAEARALLHRAAAIHYVDRNRSALATWLSGEIIEQKKADAILCLQAAMQPGESGARPERVVTSALRQLASGCGINLEARPKEDQALRIGEERRP